MPRFKIRDLLVVMTVVAVYAAGIGVLARSTKLLDPYVPVPSEVGGFAGFAVGFLMVVAVAGYLAGILFGDKTSLDAHPALMLGAQAVYFNTPAFFICMSTLLDSSEAYAGIGAFVDEYLIYISASCSAVVSTVTSISAWRHLSDRLWKTVYIGRILQSLFIFIPALPTLAFLFLLGIVVVASESQGRRYDRLQWISLAVVLVSHGLGLFWLLWLVKEIP